MYVIFKEWVCCFFPPLDRCLWNNYEVDESSCFLSFSIEVFSSSSSSTFNWTSSLENHVSRSVSGKKMRWPLYDRRICVNREKEEFFISLLGHDRGRERGELFLLPVQLDYQHWTYLFLRRVFSFSLFLFLFSFARYRPIVNYYYSNWTEQKTNLILLFRVLLFLAYSHIRNDLD